MKVTIPVHNPGPRGGYAPTRKVEIDIDAVGIDRVLRKLIEIADRGLTEMLAQIDAQPEWYRNRYYVQRLREALTNEIKMRNAR